MDDKKYGTTLYIHYIIISIRGIKNMVGQEAEESGSESGVVKGIYKVDVTEGVAEGIRLTMDRLGKIQMPPWLRERLDINGGAELLVSVKVVKRYGKKGNRKGG